MGHDKHLANRDSVERQGDLQRRYFEGNVSSRMLPVRTPYVLRQVQEVVSHGRLKEGDKVLEVGCGMGRHGFLLAEYGLELEGLDISEFLLSKFREFDGGRFDIPLYCADLRDPPEELYRRYDAVAGFFVLHHISNLESVFESLGRLLRPHGRMVFVEPNPLNPLFYIQIAITPKMRWRAEKEILSLTKTKIKRAASAAGFRDVRIKRYGFFPPQLYNLTWGRAIDGLLESIKALDRILPFQVILLAKD